jgi:peptide deformylase
MEEFSTAAPSTQLPPTATPSTTFSYNTASAPKIIKKNVELLPLYNDTNPLLAKKMPEVDFTNPPQDLNELAERLLATMSHYGGVGLAANQCGVPCRMFVMGSGIIVINPKILTTSEEMARDREGCLTFPGLTLPIQRPEKITVEFYDLSGAKQTFEYGGVTARVFQHEYDHLEGKVFTSKVGNLTLQMAKKKRQKLFKKIERIVAFKQQRGGAR